MHKGKATRDAIVGEALSQTVQLGLDRLSLGVLADSLNLSKSGLFAHFKSKEALQLAVLEEAIARFRAAVIVPSLKAAPGRPRLEAFFRTYLAWIKGEDDLGGCPFMAIGRDARDKPGAIGDLFLSSQEAWRVALAGAVNDAIKLKQFAPDTDPAQVAFEFIGIAFGYQQSLKVLEDRLSLKRANKAFDYLLGRVTFRRN
jgi:AcrR family transcriptional regulator